PIKAYDTTNRIVKLAAEVDIDIKKYFPPMESRKMDRFTQLAVIAGDEVMKDSGITDDNVDKNRCGVFVSSGIGGLSTIEREQDKGNKNGFDRVSPMFIPMAITNMASGKIAINTGFKGAATCLVTACAGGTHAIGQAFRMIRDGYLDAAVCGGAEGCVTPLAIGGFTSMQALHTGDDPARASIPFDKERSGFVLGEGAAMLMLEEFENARARGAKIYAEVVGFGESCDAYHITAPEPTGKGSALAMRNSLVDAEISAKDVDYINAHGTSTELNDKCECEAIREVFGDKADVVISSTKSMTGHLLGAAGAIEAMFCALSLRDGFILPTIGTREVSAECDLNILLGNGKSADIKYALSNSLGFGGHNGCLIFAHA
ncbi:MAG: beta-ketoacyl-ACP synthase II, partial [Ruminococcus sp.]|nr:beta-ketoacyl-ACP synthase II [Ruminococcus sp.]